MRRVGRAVFTDRMSNDNEPTTADTDESAPPTRRRLLTTGSALAAAATASTLMGGERAKAADGDNAVLGQTNRAASATVFTSTTTADALVADSESGTAITANGSTDLRLEGSGSVRFEPVVGRSIEAEFESTIPGELAVSDDGTLWFSVGESRWNRVSGPATSGAFTAVRTTRVADSRRFPGTPLATGESADFPYRFDIVDTNPDGTIREVVPRLANAITYNLTVARTTGFGFMQLGPSIPSTITGSAINWSGDDMAIANSGVLSINDGFLFGGINDLTIRAGGEGSAHYILDITGYYM